MRDSRGLHMARLFGGTYTYKIAHTWSHFACSDDSFTLNKDRPTKIVDKM